MRILENLNHFDFLTQEKLIKIKKEDRSISALTNKGMLEGRSIDQISRANKESTPLKCIIESIWLGTQLKHKTTNFTITTQMASSWIELLLDWVEALGSDNRSV